MDTTTQIVTNPHLTEDNWQIETLLKKAMARTRERLLAYFLIVVLTYGIMLGVIVAGLIVGGIIATILYFAKLTALYVILIPVLVVAGLFVLIYFSAWTGLAMVEIIIQDSRTDVIGAFKKVRPLVMGYFVIQIVLGALLIGLLPFMILSVGVVGILWVFWTSFITFVYLEKQVKGLESMWYSRALVNKAFWRIVGRMLLVNLIVFVIYFLIGYLGAMIFNNGNHSGGNAFTFLENILQFIFTPFLVSYNYEMYKNVEQGEVEVKRPTGWIITAVIGWILMLVTVALMFTAIVTHLPELQKEFNRGRNSNVNQQLKTAPKGSGNDNYELP